MFAITPRPTLGPSTGINKARDEWAPPEQPVEALAIAADYFVAL